MCGVKFGDAINRTLKMHTSNHGKPDRNLPPNVRIVAAVLKVAAAGGVTVEQRRNADTGKLNDKPVDNVVQKRLRLVILSQMIMKEKKDGQFGFY